MKEHLVVLSGAGMSAESGIATFRNSGGLWENHNIMDVASPEGWARDPHMVLQFYNERRKNLLGAKPNAAHLDLVKLEEKYKVTVITQNVDNLHEKAGSSRVIHLHGELLKVESSTNPSLVYEWEQDVQLGDLAEDGGQLRPHVVWFGEMVPMIKSAVEICSTADLFIIIGTSLQVYPAASMIHYVPDHIIKYLIDPEGSILSGVPNLQIIKQTATEGTQYLISKLL